VNPIPFVPEAFWNLKVGVAGAAALEALVFVLPHPFVQRCTTGTFFFIGLMGLFTFMNA
jgi:hypothetical protein